MMTLPAQQRPAVRYSATDIAKCLVNIAYEEEAKRAPIDPDTQEPLLEGVTHLKLQKILYFAQAASLAVNDVPLFEQPIEAWELGPVVRDVYQVFAQYRNGPIPEQEGACVLPQETEDFLRKVWKTFGKYTAAELVRITHRHEPWKHAMATEGKIIALDEMKSFYKTIFVPANDR